MYIYSIIYLEESSTQSSRNHKDVCVLYIDIYVMYIYPIIVCNRADLNTGGSICGGTTCRGACTIQ